LAKLAPLAGRPPASVSPPPADQRRRGEFPTKCDFFAPGNTGDLPAISREPIFRFFAFAAIGLRRASRTECAAVATRKDMPPLGETDVRSQFNAPHFANTTDAAAARQRFFAPAPRRVVSASYSIAQRLPQWQRRWCSARRIVGLQTVS
jgi:hypothetical protein